MKKIALQLFEQIKHGDQEHQVWLLEALEAFFEGNKVPEPRGGGTKDKLYEEIKRLEEENDKLKKEVETLKAILLNKVF